MADLNDYYNELFIFDRIDDPVVALADAILV